MWILNKLDELIKLWCLFSMLLRPIQVSGSPSLGARAKAVQVVPQLRLGLILQLESHPPVLFAYTLRETMMEVEHSLLVEAKSLPRGHFHFPMFVG